MDALAAFQIRLLREELDETRERLRQTAEVVHRASNWHYPGFHLTVTERAFLGVLLHHLGPVDRDVILNWINVTRDWKKIYASIKSVDIVKCRLAKKIAPIKITMLHGVGYWLAPADRAMLAELAI